MGSHLSRSKLVSATAIIGLVLAGWFLFAPLQLGGSDSYVITSGISMLPRFHAGDLVILRSQANYGVGEVAGYHNAQLGATVMHRIVAIHDGHYFFKGDNNNFVDSYHPTEAKIVGAEWIHLPGWGNFLLTLRSPVIVAVLLGVMWLWLFRPRSGSRRQRRRRRHAH